MSPSPPSSPDKGGNDGGQKKKQTTKRRSYRKKKSPPSPEQEKKRSDLRLAKKSPFSLSTQNQEKLDFYRGKCLQGLKASFAAYKLEFPDESMDYKWLEEHGGRFMMHLHPRSTSSTEICSLRNCKDDSERDIIARNKYNAVYGVSPRFKQSVLAANTQQNYERIICQFWDFLLMIGDYDSMIILLAESPPNSPSVRQKSIELFCHHRCLKTGTDLGVPDASSPSQNVTSEGTVHNNKWMASFFAGLVYLHGHQNQGGSYTERCDSCHGNFLRGNLSVNS